MTPPFTRGLVMQFVNKLLGELAAGNVTAAILLTNSETETAWFQLAASKASRVCFPKGRIRFLRGPTGGPGSPQMGQTLFYFGPDGDRFAEVFGQLGVVTTPVPLADTDAAPASEGNAA